MKRGVIEYHHVVLKLGNDSEMLFFSNFPPGENNPKLTIWNKYLITISDDRENVSFTNNPLL